LGLRARFFPLPMHAAAVLTANITRSRKIKKE
jgi:hypothetical protein